MQGSILKLSQLNKQKLRKVENIFSKSKKVTVNKNEHLQRIQFNIITL